MATRSSALKINILGDYDSLRKAVTKSVGQVDRLDKSVKKSSKTTFRDMGKAAFGAAAGLGAIAVAGNEVKKSINDTVDLAKATRQLQRATGLASEDASRLAAVLKVRGMNTDKLGRSFTTLARNVEAAKTGTGGAADAFAKLGVSQKALAQGNINQILVQAADGFKKLGDGTTKASVAQALFGRNSRDLLPLLEGGSKKLREQLQLAPQLTQKQQEQALSLVTAQRNVQLALMGVRTELATALLPYLQKAAKFITEMFQGGDTQGGRFAAKLKEIWKAVKPIAEQFGRVVKAVFEFAAANPKLVQLAAAFAAVGLAIKGMKFVSAISGLSTFLDTAKGLGGPLKKLFSRFGTRAGGAFASEAAGNMAADMGGALTPGGTVGRMGGKKGAFGKWGARMGKAAVFGFIAGFVAIFGDSISRAISNELGKIGLPKLIQDHFLGFFGADAQAPTVNPKSKGYKDWAKKYAPKRGRPRAKGSSIMGFARGNGGVRGPAASNPARSWLNSYGGDVAAQLALAEARSEAAQKRYESLQNATSGRKKSSTEAKNLRELKRLANEAQREVAKLQRQLGRRDALADITQQFKDFAQGFADAYSAGLERIQQARLQASQKVSQQILDDQLKALDEEDGQSQEAQRIRELRLQQEQEQKAREDKDYAENKKLLEDELARAIRNGNITRQTELNKSIEDLDTARRDTIRNREIQDLSESLARQRKAAQDEYEARNKASQDYYDNQVILNQQLVENYKARVQEQMDALQNQLETGKLSYADYNTRINELSGVLTGMLNADLATRAANERNALANQVGVYGGYVNQINAEFSRVMSTIPAPSIPPIPRITVDVWLNYLNPVPNLPTTSNPPTNSTPNAPAPKTAAEALAAAKALPRGTYNASRLGSDWRWSQAKVWSWANQGSVEKVLKKEGVKILNRASGGRLSRSGLTMVGETGPELVMNGQVYSASRTKRMGSGAGVTLNVYPQTTADDPAQLARALGWQLANR